MRERGFVKRILMERLRKDTGRGAISATSRGLLVSQRSTMLRIWSLLFSGAFLLCGERALAQESDARVLRWADLPTVADELFDATSGAAAQARVDGWRDAQQEIAGRWTQSQFGVAPGVGALQTDRGDSEVVVYGFAMMQLSDVPGRNADWYETSAAAAEATSAASRMEYRSALQQAWLLWMSNERVVRHLREDIVEYDQELAGLRAAASSQMLTALALSEFEAELSRLRSELSSAEAASAAAAAELVAVAGVPVLPEYPADADLPGWRHELNPWAEVAGFVGALPGVRAAHAEADALVAQAQAVESNPWQIGIGAEVHRETNGFTWGAATLDFYVPLSNPNRAQSVRLQAESDAARLEAAQRSRQWLASVEAWRLEYDALMQLIAEREVGLLAALQSRVELYEQALAAGQALAPDLIRARRDQHEALHAQIILESQAFAEFCRATAMREMLAAMASVGGNP